MSQPMDVSNGVYAPARVRQSSGPLTGVPKLVLGGPVRLGGLPTKACARTLQYIGVSIYINNVHVGPYQWRAS